MDINYTELINMALDIKDFKWAKELVEKQKRELNQEPKQENKENSKKFQYKNIALEDMDNNLYAIQVEDGVRMAISIEELEKYNIVLVKSKREIALRILKGEEVIIEEIPTENKYIYKVMYQNYNKGFDNGEAVYYQYFEECLRLRKQVNDLILTNEILVQRINHLPNVNTNINNNKFSFKNLFKRKK